MKKEFLLHKDNENVNTPHIQTHLAASSTGDRFVAKRAFILPTHHPDNKCDKKNEK